MKPTFEDWTNLVFYLCALSGCIYIIADFVISEYKEHKEHKEHKD